MSNTIMPTVFYRTLKVEGLEIFYREAGPQDASTVLLLHGFPSSSHMFRNLIPTDISKAEGHVVPTSAVLSEGSLIVGNLGLFPITPDSSILMTLKPNPLEALIDSLDPWAPDPLHLTGTSSPGLTTVVSMAWGPDGALYVLELSAAPGLPMPGAGKVVRVRGRGMAEDVITGLSVPTGITFRPDGALYVSNWGAADAPVGQILRFDVR